MKSLRALTPRLLGPGIAFLLINGAAAADPAQVREFAAQPGGRLVVDFEPGGALSITGWDQDKIHVEWTDDSNDSDVWTVEYDLSDNGLEITAEQPQRRTHTNSLHFEIKVPRRYDLSYESGGGSLEIGGVEGDFDGHSGGGHITLVDVKGAAGLSTGGGQIVIRDSELDGRVTTGGGTVLVENVVGNVRATSGGGEVRYVNVRSADGPHRAPGVRRVEDATEHTVLISNAGGRIRVSDAPEGAVVSTGGGDVRVTGANRLVKASTGGGDIHIELEQGWIRASTGAGDINAAIAKAGGDGEIVLSSGYGDITLVVPDDFGMDLDIDLRYTRDSSRDFRIVSEFDSDLEKTDEWERDRGSNWCKHIFGTGTVNGGGRRVEIVTTNGNVHIEKKRNAGE